MPNTLLTPLMVTRKALMILHQKLNFISNITRDYDDSYAKEGAKQGDTLKIRLPNRYTVGSGAAITPQDTTETSVSLVVGTQKHVPMKFTTAELALSIDDFATRIIEPAMAVLAATMEADAFTMVADVYQQVGTPGTVPTSLLTYLQANARLTNSLAPLSSRSLHLHPLATATIVDALKGLFHDSEAIKEQYREGLMGRTAGMDWYDNTLAPAITNGNKVSGVTVNGASQTGSSLNIGGVAANDTFKKGQVFTIAGVNEVHPETKVDTGRLQKFVVTADVTMSGTTGTISISPSIVTSGANQTVTGSPANGAALTFDGSASQIYPVEVACHKQAFAFATADLVVPKGVDFGARETFDGISLRIIRDYDVTNDNIITRVDVLYGFKAIRPELACRIASG